MRSLLGALALVFGMGVVGPSCIIVEDDHHHHVYCDYECDGDFVVWACDDGYVEDVDDCWDLCDGTCAYFNDEPACACPG